MSAYGYSSHIRYVIAGIIVCVYAVHTRMCGVSIINIATSAEH